MENLKRLNEELKKYKHNANILCGCISGYKKEIRKYNYLFQNLINYRKELRVIEDKIKVIKQKIKIIQRNNELI